MEKINLKVCEVDMVYGVRLTTGKLVNPNVKVTLSQREILQLLKKGRTKVYHIVEGERYLQTIENYTGVDYIPAKVVKEEPKVVIKEAKPAPVVEVPVTEEPKAEPPVVEEAPVIEEEPKIEEVKKTNANQNKKRK